MNLLNYINYYQSGGLILKHLNPSSPLILVSNQNVPNLWLKQSEKARVQLWGDSTPEQIANAIKYNFHSMDEVKAYLKKYKLGSDGKMDTDGILMRFMDKLYANDPIAKNSKTFKIEPYWKQQSIVVEDTGNSYKGLEEDARKLGYATYTGEDGVTRTVTYPVDFKNKTSKRDMAALFYDKYGITPDLILDKSPQSIEFYENLPSYGYDLAEYFENKDNKTPTRDSSTGKHINRGGTTISGYLRDASPGRAARINLSFGYPVLIDPKTGKRPLTIANSEKMNKSEFDYGYAFTPTYDLHVVDAWSGVLIDEGRSLNEGGFGNGNMTVARDKNGVKSYYDKWDYNVIPGLDMDFITKSLGAKPYQIYWKEGVDDGKVITSKEKPIYNDELSIIDSIKLANEQVVKPTVLYAFKPVIEKGKEVKTKIMPVVQQTILAGKEHINDISEDINQAKSDIQQNINSTVKSVKTIKNNTIKYINSNYENIKNNIIQGVNNIFSRFKR